MNYPIPVTILTGFLGSGKTTLLNTIIKNNPHIKFAIIENEFGEIGIDNELVVGAEEGIFELANGCVCCTMNDELINVLEGLLKSEYKIDHLLIETTGVADPGPVAMSFLGNPDIQKYFYVDSVTALADARFIEQQLEDQEVACKQIAVADAVLINKTDQVEPYQIDTVKNIVRRMNPFATLDFCSFGETSLNLLNRNSFSKENIEITSFKSVLPVKKSIDTFDNNLFGKPLHHKSISSHSFCFPVALDLIRFDIWIRMVLNEKGMDCYRVKGILNFRDTEDKIVFQAVNNQYITESGGKWNGEARESRIVFIGRYLNKEILEQGLEICTSAKPFSPENFYAEIVKTGLV